MSTTPSSAEERQRRRHRIRAGEGAARATPKLKITLAYWGDSVDTKISNRMDSFNPYEANDLGGKLPVAYSLRPTSARPWVRQSAQFDELPVRDEQGDRGRQPGPAIRDVSHRLRRPERRDLAGFRISSQGEKTINYVAGLYFKSYLNHGELIDLSGSTVPPAALIGETSFERTDYAVYGELSANLMNGLLTPVVGSRWKTAASAASPLCRCIRRPGRANGGLHRRQRQGFHTQVPARHPSRARHVLPRGLRGTAATSRARHGGGLRLRPAGGDGESGRQTVELRGRREVESVRRGAVQRKFRSMTSSGTGPSYGIRRGAWASSWSATSGLWRRPDAEIPHAASRIQAWA